MMMMMKMRQVQVEVQQTFLATAHICKSENQDTTQKSSSFFLIKFYKKGRESGQGSEAPRAGLKKVRKEYCLRDLGTLVMVDKSQVEQNAYEPEKHWIYGKREGTR
jgi:hypothetical protein